MSFKSITINFLTIAFISPMAIFSMNVQSNYKTYLATTFDTYLTLNRENQHIQNPFYQPLIYIPTEINKPKKNNLCYYPVSLTPLMEAIGDNDVSTVKKLLNNGAMPQEASFYESNDNNRVYVKPLALAGSMLTQESLEIFKLLLGAIRFKPIEMSQFQHLRYSASNEDPWLDPIMLPAMKPFNKIKLAKYKIMLAHYKKNRIIISVNPFLQLIDSSVDKEVIKLLQKQFSSYPFLVNEIGGFFNNNGVYEKSTLLIKACEQLNIPLTAMLLENGSSPIKTLGPLGPQHMYDNPLSKAVYSYLNSSNANIRDLKTIIVLLLEYGLNDNKNLAIKWLNGYLDSLKLWLEDYGVYWKLQNFILAYRREFYYRYIDIIESAKCETCTIL